VSDDPIQSTPLEPVRPTVSAPRRSSFGRWLNLLLAVAAAVAIGGIAFAVGRSTAPAAAGGFGQFRDGNFPGGSFDPNASFAPGRGGFFAAGGLTVEGTVQSVSGDTLTIATESGRTVEVTLGADTEYHKQAAGAASDVTTGSKVSVQVDLAGRGQADSGQGGGGATSGPTGTASDVTVIP
jgi:hypothetical protein